MSAHRSCRARLPIARMAPCHPKGDNARSRESSSGASRNLSRSWDRWGGLPIRVGRRALVYELVGLQLDFRLYLDESTKIAVGLEVIILANCAGSESLLGSRLRWMLNKNKMWSGEQRRGCSGWPTPSAALEYVGGLIRLHAGQTRRHCKDFGSFDLISVIDELLNDIECH